MMLTLTDAEAETIHELHSMYSLELTFAPDEAFPGRDNKDNGHRRTVMNLDRKGLLKHVAVHPTESHPHLITGDEHYRLRLTDEAINAFEIYAIKLDYQFPW